MTEEVIVTVKEGKLRGFKTKSAYSGVEYYTFLGVPYGQSTAGEARFKDPVKIEPWENIRDATIERQGCIQFSQLRKRIMGSEDCLYNNIYTPQIPSEGDQLNAVIFWIHPGCLFNGTPDPSYYGSPDYVMHQNVVYVSVGYRLHTFGFLNLDLDECSGNQCLKDVILSLKWIKENIRAFGGDPNNVTIMGLSSGAAIVHTLLLSPLSKGLYHKAVLMGMYEFNPLVVASNQHIPIAYELARKMGHKGEEGDSKKLLRFYKELDAARLLNERFHRYFYQTTLTAFPVSLFHFTTDPKGNSTLPIPLKKLIPTVNRVPVIIGFCDKEAALAFAVLPFVKLPFAESFRKCVTQNCWGWGANLNDNELTFIQKQVESFYLNGAPIETASQSNFCDILTDIALSDVYDSTINIISADQRVYVYNFKYDSKLCRIKRTVQNTLSEPLEGSVHGSELTYWNHDEEMAGKNMEYIEPKDREVIDKFTNLLTSFAKTGNPNYKGMEVKWKPTTQDQPHHLIIDETLEAQDGLLNGERMQFWHDLKKNIKLGSNLDL